MLCIGVTIGAACAAGAHAQEPAPAPAPAVWNYPASIYPDLSVAPPEDVADANRLWLRSKRSAAKLFPTVAAARKKGYKGHVSKINRPKPFFFHLRNTKLHDDGRELDPRYPEAIVYWYDPPRPMVLVAFMYRVHEGKEPAYARSVLPWHSPLRRLVRRHAHLVHQRPAQRHRPQAAAPRVLDRLRARLRRPDAGLSVGLPTQGPRRR